MSEALRFDQVSFRYDDEEVVNHVSFSIAQGEVVCLLGPSGCGKTTCLRLAAGMERPQAGTISLNGEVVSSADRLAPPETRHIGFLFQEFALFPHLSVYDNICFGLTHLSAGEQKARALELLKQVGLSGYADKFPNSLSGGQQQRLCIARTIAVSPEVILMDEPCSALDPIATAKIEELIHELSNQFTIVIVTHSMQQAARVSNRTAYFHLGKLVEVGETAEIFSNPSHEMTTNYITGRFG